MKGYLVDAGERTITPIDYTYLGMRKWLPGGLTIAATFDNGDVLYVDDEALLHPPKVAFRVAGRSQPMMSNGVLTGRDHGDETLPPDMPIEQLARHIEWLTVDEAMQWFRDRIDEPATVAYGDDGKSEVLAYWRNFIDSMAGGKVDKG